MWLLLLVVFFLASILAYIIISTHKTLNFFRDTNVPFIKPWPILGNMAEVFFQQKSFTTFVEDSYKTYPNDRYYGFFQFTKPTLMLRDPELIKDVLIKNFDAFTNHLNFLPKSTDTFWNKNLFAMKGREWHDMRCILSPLFTGSKMRKMFLLMTECAQKYVDHLKREANETVLEVEIKNVLLRFTNDIIASTAFGVELNSIEDQDNEFYRLGKNAFDFKGIKALKFFGSTISSKLMKFLRVQFFDVHFQQFFKKLVNDTIDFRDRTGYVRPDMIHFLHEAQKGRSLADEDEDVPDVGFAVVEESQSTSKINKKTIITNEDIAAQAAIFFFGGFDTLGIALSHAVYELALNIDVQQRLIEEIDQALEECNYKPTYEVIVKLKYLDMVISESLRLWSPGVIINRKCSKSFTIEPKLPHEKPLTLEKGWVVNIPIRGIHRDPNYYPNPDKFDPERFNAENKHKIQSGTYIPFGAGPRNCIASRFALMEIKVLIFFLLQNFKIVPVKRTKIPFVISNKQALIGSDHGYWVGLQLRK